jgi:hypothetical protein
VSSAALRFLENTWTHEEAQAVVNKAWEASDLLDTDMIDQITNVSLGGTNLIPQAMYVAGLCSKEFTSTVLTLENFVEGWPGLPRQNRRDTGSKHRHRKRNHRHRWCGPQRAHRITLPHSLSPPRKDHDAKKLD